MNTLSFDIADIHFDVTYKNMKNLRMRILPNLTVAVSAPFGVSETQVIAFAEKNIEWVKKHLSLAEEKLKAEQQCAQKLEYIYVLGTKIPIIYEIGINPYIKLSHDSLTVCTQDVPSREAVLSAVKELQRNIFKQFLPELASQCEKMARISPNEWRIKDMRTRWGTCNVKDKRIWLRLDLIAYPKDCIKAVMIHELTHLYEPSHNKRFYELMNSFYPENSVPNDILRKNIYTIQ